MKICILGNSHAASLKKGWDEISSDYPQIQLAFFASRQKGLDALDLENGQLVPKSDALAKDMAFTSGGMDRVDLEAYDVFLTYGLGLAVPSLDLRCSKAVMRQTCLDVLFESLNLKLCKMIRMASDKPIFIGHAPQKAPPSPRSELRINKLSYYDTLNLMNKQLNLEQAVIVAQPEATLLNQWFTDQRFSIGSTRLDVGDQISGQPHPDSDFGHMNSEFGKIWLESFFAR